MDSDPESIELNPEEFEGLSFLKKVEKASEKRRFFDNAGWAIEKLFVYNLVTLEELKSIGVQEYDGEGLTLEEWYNIANKATYSDELSPELKKKIVSISRKKRLPRD